MSEAGPWRRSQRYRWRPRVPTLSASHGNGRAGPFDRRRLGLGKRRHWRAVCGMGSWLRLDDSALAVGKGGGATGGVRERVDQPVRGRQRRARDELRQARATVRAAAGRSGSQLVRAASTAAPLEAGKPSWFSGASVEGGSYPRRQSSRRKGRPRKRRSAGCEPCAREHGFPRVLVTTDRLQRLVRGIFCPTGSRRFGAGCTEGSSVVVAADTVTGRRLRRATRVPQVAKPSG